MTKESNELKPHRLVPSKNGVLGVTVEKSHKGGFYLRGETDAVVKAYKEQISELQEENKKYREHLRKLEQDIEAAGFKELELQSEVERLNKHLDDVIDMLDDNTRMLVLKELGD